MGGLLVAGQAEEDVVERGLVHGEAGDGLARRGRPRRAARARARRCRRWARRATRRSGRGRRRGRRAGRPRRRRRPRRPARGRAAARPTRRLELGGGALGDDAPAVDHGDPVGQPVGLLEVLGGEEHGDAARRRARRRPPTGLRGCAGPGPVVGSSRKTHRGLGDEARGEVQPAAHAARVGGDAPARGRAVEAEAVQQVGGAGVRRRRGRPASRPIIRRFSAPVCSASSAGVLAGEADRPRAPRRARPPRRTRPRATVPASAAQQRGQDPHRGRLAGAVGAEQGEHAARRRPQVDAARARGTSP